MQNLLLKAELEKNKSDIEMLKAAIDQGTNQLKIDCLSFHKDTT